MEEILETTNEVRCIDQGSGFGRQGKNIEEAVSFLKEGVLTVPNLVKGKENKHESIGPSSYIVNPKALRNHIYFSR